MLTKFPEVADKKKVWELIALSYTQVFALPLEWIKQQPTPKDM